MKNGVLAFAIFSSLVIIGQPVHAMPEGTANSASSFVASSSFVPLSKDVKVVGKPDPQKVIWLDIFLNIRNPENLTELVKRGKGIGTEELLRDYAPSAEDYNALEKWLLQRGITVVNKFETRMLMQAQGTVAQLETVLQTEFVLVKVKDEVYASIIKAPTLPPDGANLIRAINGLQQNLSRYRSESRIVDNP